ncbi:winged helix-turn-helix domain-containing protein [Thermoproteota archaeon]
MTVTRRNDVEDIIIQVLSHHERRNIIEILGISSGGVSYSEILGEIGLNTGKMNYHLKLLEGVIERDKNRRYTLTPIGKKAFMILNSISEDLENGYEDYLSKARTSQGAGIRKIVKFWYGLVALLSFSALAAVWVFVDWEIGSGTMSSSSMFYVYGLVLLTSIGLYFGWGWVQKHAESVQELVNRIMGKLNKR